MDRASTTREVDLLREEIAQSLEGHDKNLKEWTRSKITHMTSQMRCLENFAAEVENFVREKCSPQESGGTASEPSYTPGRERVSVSNEATQSTSSAGASGSTARAPAYIQTPVPPTIAPPSVPTSATHSSTIQSDVRAGAIRVEISDPEQWSSGDVAILQNQEAERVRETGDTHEIKGDDLHDDATPGVDETQRAS